MEHTDSLIGVDIGGTKMQFALVRGGKVEAQSQVATRASETRDELVGDILRGIESLMDDSVRGIGIGVPGLVDMAAGEVVNVTNIPCFSKIRLAPMVEERFGIPAFLGNDANCFALGEKYYGKGRQYDDLVCLTLGTGVGAGVIIGGRLYGGNCAMAGEFGGIKYLDADYEMYCSGKFFTSKYGQTALAAAQQADADDPRALGMFAEYGRHVGDLIQTIIYSCGPQAIILGGSLPKAYRHFRAGMEDNLSGFAHRHALDRTYIDVSDDPHMAVLGAAALAAGCLG